MLIERTESRRGGYGRTEFALSLGYHGAVSHIETGKASLYQPCITAARVDDGFSSLVTKRYLRDELLALLEFF